MIPSSSISAADASPTAQERTHAAARGATAPRASARQQLRVAESGGHAADRRVDEHEADRDGPGDRAAPDLVAREHAGRRRCRTARARP